MQYKSSLFIIKVGTKLNSDIKSGPLETNETLNSTPSTTTGSGDGNILNPKMSEKNCLEQQSQISACCVCWAALTISQVSVALCPKHSGPGSATIPVGRDTILIKIKQCT